MEQMGNETRMSADKVLVIIEICNAIHNHLTHMDNMAQLPRSFHNHFKRPFRWAGRGLLGRIAHWNNSHELAFFVKKTENFILDEEKNSEPDG